MAIARVGFERIIAGIVSVATLLQDSEDLVVDGKARSPVANNFGAGDVFKEVFASDEILLEIFSAHVMTQLMAITMGGDFVSLASNLFH